MPLVFNQPHQPNQKTMAPENLQLEILPFNQCLNHTALFQNRTTPFRLSSPRPTFFKPTSIKCATQLHTQPPPLTHAQDRVFNFVAGTATLLEKVLLRAQSELYNWGGSGMSVMEMSHRGKEFLSIIQKAESDLRTLLQIPPEYSVLFLQGGATTQFAVVPLNLCSPDDVVDFIVTGSSGDKAAKEAQKYCKPNVIWFGKSEKYTKVTIDPLLAPGLLGARPNS